MILTLYLINFNNYYNRRVIRKETLDEYLNELEDYDVLTNFDFNTNNEVNTTIVWDIPTTTPDRLIGNYLLAVDKKDIVSRWYVLDIQRLGGWKYSLNLMRDTAADSLPDLLDGAYVHLEKGYIADTENPLLFNDERFTANQIKKQEIELKDKLGLKWLVGYWNKNSLTEKTTYKTSLNDLHNAALTVNDKSEINVLYDGTFCFKNAWVVFNYAYYYYAATKQIYHNAKVNNTQSIITSISSPGSSTLASTEPVKPITSTHWDEIMSYSRSYYSAITQEEYNKLLNEENNKVVYVQNEDKYYIVHFSAKGGDVNFNLNVSTFQPLYNIILNSFPTIAQSSPSNDNFLMEFTRSALINVEWEEIIEESYNTAIDPTLMNQTINEAYNVFAIPILDKKVRFEIVGEGPISGSFESDDYNSAFAIAQEILDIQNVALDLQLLPFAPIKHEITFKDDGTPIITLSNSRCFYDFVSINNESGAAKNTLFFLDKTDFTTYIPFTDTNDYSTPEAVKSINQLDTYRIVAGDYSSAFEFNPAKNKGINYFKVDCKYKPYHPYIHVAPDFSGLYGGDFNDTRGLICSNTNFSVSRATDAWESYERSNINYQNAFNRQIQNMDTMRDIQKKQELAAMVAGSIQGAGGGAALGSYGGVVGGTIGAIAGGVSSAIAGVADFKYSQAIFEENRSLYQDQFRMSLENIQALPNTLAATGAQNPNNKVFPLLEIYSCSDEEKEIFLNKIKFTGMTINAITNKVSNYLKSQEDTYIKGQLIRINANDNHYITTLAQELMRGFYIVKEDK